MQGLNATGQWTAEKKNKHISPLKSPNEAILLFQLFLLGFGDSVLLLSSSPKTTGKSNVFYDVLRSHCLSPCASPKFQELYGYWETWETALGWEMPGSLWLQL